METLSGRRGSEALNSGACRKLILFLPFLPPIPALPPGCHLGRCRRKSLYSSVNEVLMNLEGKDGEGGAAAPHKMFYTCPACVKALGDEIYPDQTKGGAGGGRGMLWFPRPLQNAKGISGSPSSFKPDSVHSVLLKFHALCHTWTLHLLVPHLELLFTLLWLPSASSYISLLPS